jgi:hypothetical protein
MSRRAGWYIPTRSRGWWSATSRIEKPVRALNFGEVTVLDTDGKPVIR